MNHSSRHPVPDFWEDLLEEQELTVRLLELVEKVEQWAEYHSKSCEGWCKEHATNLFLLIMELKSEILENNEERS